MIKRSPPSSGGRLEHKLPPSGVRREPFWPANDITADPGHLPARYVLAAPGSEGVDAGNLWEIRIFHDRVERRCVSAGAIGPCERFALASFDAVTIRLGHRACGALAISVELVSDDLVIPLYAASRTDEAALMWFAWSRALGVPLRLTGDGVSRDPLDGLGDTANIANPPRRRGLALKSRRVPFGLRVRACGPRKARHMPVSAAPEIGQGA